jgi:peroxiredoxin
VLWTDGVDSPNKIKGFDPSKENDGISQSAKNYIEGIYSGDAKLLESVVFPDFSKLTYNKIPETGKLMFNRRMYSFLLELSLSKLAFIGENQRNYKISVLDVMDGMALVEIATPRSFDYLQMYKDGDKWKVFHSLVKPNPSYSFISNLPPSIGQQMPDFTLPIYQGGDFTLSKYKGKNILVIFPRGWIGDHWCQVCYYQYAELMELLKDKTLLKKYNLEVVYILPYSKEEISDWVLKLPDGLKTIEDWKKPQGPNADFANYITANFSSKLEVKPGELSIPILIDSERIVSKKFQLFTNFWDGIKSEQNIPTIFIIDKNGKIQFKYHSQTTFDRPNAEYLINQMKTNFNKR